MKTFEEYNNGYELMRKIKLELHQGDTIQEILDRINIFKNKRVTFFSGKERTEIVNDVKIIFYGDEVYELFFYINKKWVDVEVDDHIIKIWGKRNITEEDPYGEEDE